MLEVLAKLPEFAAGGIVAIESLAPLSLVTKMPGKFYRSESSPSVEMLYGLMENALGWHFGPAERTAILLDVCKRLKTDKKQISASGCGFQSLLQFHVQVAPVAVQQAPETLMRYNDLWSQHLRTNGTEFPGGSRNYDAQVIPIMNAKAQGEITFTDSGGAVEVRLLGDFKPGDAINVKLLRSYFPQYYVTPTVREFIVPQYAYHFLIKTSPNLAAALADAFADPVAPLYLGNNEGWVDVTWRDAVEVHTEAKEVSV